MSNDDNIVYVLNQHDQIVSVEGPWDELALQNGAPNLIFARIRGRSLWDFISGEAITHIYRRIVERARAGETVKFDFRCDSPHVRRYLTLFVSPCGNDGVRFETCTVRTEERSDHTILLAGTGSSEQMIITCSWCNKLKIDDDLWIEAEHAVGVMRLFENSPSPLLSHGMCDYCYEAALDQIPKKQ